MHAVPQTKSGEEQNISSEKIKAERKICSECGVAFVVWGRKSRFHAMGFGVWIGCHEAFNFHIIIMQHYFTRITACYLFWSCRELWALWSESVYHLTHAASFLWGGVRLHQVRTHLCWWHVRKIRISTRMPIWLGLVHACMRTCYRQFTNECMPTHTHTLCWALSVKSKVTATQSWQERCSPTKYWWHSTEMMFSLWRIISLSDQTEKSPRRQRRPQRKMRETWIAFI